MRTFFTLSVVMLATTGSGVLAEDTPVKVSAILAGEKLKAGESKYSPNGKYSLRMQNDGNLVWYCGDAAQWDSGTGGTKDSYCVVQEDGNFVVYGTRDGSKSALWSSNTNKGQYLKHMGGLSIFAACQDDGNLVVYMKQSDMKNLPLWDSCGVSKAATDRFDALAPKKMDSGYFGLPSPGETFQLSLAISQLGTGRVSVEIVPGNATAAGEQRASTESVKVKIEEGILDIEMFKDSIDILEGVVAEYTLERSYERTLTSQGSVSVEVGGKVTGSIGPKLLLGSAEVTAETRLKVEASLGMTVGTKETFTQKITVDGNKTPNLKVIWLHRYKKGVVTLPDGKEEPFLVCVGVRWKLKKE